jgi:integrase
VSPIWNALLLTEIPSAEVHRVIYEHIGDKLTGTGRETLWKMIRRIFEMAVNDGLVPKNPASAFKVRRDTQEGQVLTSIEAQRLLDAARETFHRFWSIWTFALMSGMRSGEMYAIRWIDVDFAAGTISVSKQWTNKDGICPPKADSNRIVPMSENFKKFLLEWRQLSGGFKKELFDSRTKEMTAHEDYILPWEKDWTNGMQADVLRDFCKVIGITPVKFHDLRATFITNLLAQGVQLAKVMMIVGHRKLGTTDRYLRRAGVPVLGATEALGYMPPEEAQAANVVNFRPLGGK